MAEPNGATAIGDDLYLFRSPVPSRECLISAHGGTKGGNELFQVPDRVTVQFYTYHGFSLIDPGLALAAARPAPKEVIEGPGMCHEYLLSKYQGRHGGGKESYDDVERAVKSEADRLLGARSKLRALEAQGASPTKLAMAQSNVATSHPFNVVTIRNRFFSGTMRLSTLIQQVRLVAPEIQLFHCSFCRTSVTHETDYSTRATSSQVVRG
jgi:hypothetical protein